MHQSFSATDFHTRCDKLAATDADLRLIIQNYDYPPFWSRPNTFETLVHIILEQQVSLASAKAALEKLRARIGTITPANVLALSDQELKAAYFSRQKITYVRELSHQIEEGQLELESLALLSDLEIRDRLLMLKGVGNWTIDIYLIMVLHRNDVFPIGDLAVISALKQLKGLPKATPRDDLLPILERWQPYRTVATMLLWHYYLSVRALSAK